MLKALSGAPSTLDDFVAETIPPDIRNEKTLSFPELSESEVTSDMRKLEDQNLAARSLIGCGYYGTIVPPVIQRNVLENPGWYTSYTPYQAEISQGRLESLVNFQTMVTDLTGLSIANASILDEGTAAAEAMTLSMNSLPTSRLRKPGKCFVLSEKCHPQTIAVMQSRAHGFDINIVVGNVLEKDCQLVRDQGDNLIGVLTQYPDTEGGVFDFSNLSEVIHKQGATFSVATDLLALTLLKPPGEFGADIAFGNAQRFGVPLGFGGPHAAFFACGEKHKRKIPGRLVGVSKDRLGKPAMRLALQTREQHIRREKATSNICTAQALLANMSAFYAVYHGPEGLRRIAQRVWDLTRYLQYLLSQKGFNTVVSPDGLRSDGAVSFDTLVVEGEKSSVESVLQKSGGVRNYRELGDTRLGISLDERTTLQDVFSIASDFGVSQEGLEKALGAESTWIKNDSIPQHLERTSKYLQHPVFNSHHSETELLRYIHHLQSKDLSLVHSMIPLGSCTMKLNATTEMLPVSWAKFSDVHPFAPLSQTKGYRELVRRLSQRLVEITGMDNVSLQPNSGAQGEFAGLRVIKKYLDDNPETKGRNICLIPVSAHGTNPASAAMAGMKVVPLKCETKTGNLDVADLKEKCEKHKDALGAIMVTYPSTFGVFEPEIKKVCQMVHDHGGQVYMDGANLNAQIGLCNPGEIGADVCHLNLHKTFCIPHGGGGPGVGPIAVKSHLAPHLPSHPIQDPQFLALDGSKASPEREKKAISPVSAAPWGSASILPISYAYIMMMGSEGLTRGTKIALLNANYIMARLQPFYDILYTNENGRCAHEFILDIRPFKDSCGIEAVDVAKRLQDYGFHAPTMSWPVANTLMIEPTESESKEELDRFCDALIEIRKEIKAVEAGEMPKEGNVLKMAPHPQLDLLTNEWDRPYGREQAAYPLPWLREKKFWPSVARVDDGELYDPFFTTRFLHY